MFNYNSNYYNMGYSSTSRHSITIPMLLPGPKHIIETEILNIDPQGRSGSIGVMLSHCLLGNNGISTMR